MHASFYGAAPLSHQWITRVEFLSVLYLWFYTCITRIEITPLRTMTKKRKPRKPAKKTTTTLTLSDQAREGGKILARARGTNLTQLVERLRDRPLRIAHGAERRPDLVRDACHQKAEARHLLGAGEVQLPAAGATGRRRTLWLLDTAAASKVPALFKPPLA